MADRGPTAERGFLRENSLSIVFGLLFLAALAGTAVAGRIDYNAEEAAHGGEAVSFWTYVTSSSFGRQVMENRQSEYLAVGSFAIFAIYLRQRGSPESKPVGAPHDATGIEG